jgi:phosphoglycerate-specific signal transduction histidine kinase
MLAFVTMNPILLLSTAGSALYIAMALLIIILGVFAVRYRQQMQKVQRDKQELLVELNKCKGMLKKLNELDELIPELQKIAKLDHDVNTPLCVITMSLGRAKRLGQENNDESLLNNVQDILNSVGRIQEIMQAVRILKTNPLVAYKIKGVPAKDMGH